MLDTVTFSVWIQVRGRSTFDDMESVGAWSNPELLTIQRVPPPSNIQVTSFNNVERVVNTINQNLEVSVTVSLEWMPPFNFDGSIDHYEVILGRRQVSRFYSGSVESVIRTVLVC